MDMSNDDDKVIFRFIIILVVVLVSCVGIFFATKYLVKKEDTTKEETSKEVEIDNSVAIVGTMLNKKENEYYVIIYDKKSSDAYTYSSLVTSYSSKPEHLPVYTVDLSNGLNSKYYSKEETNPKDENLNDLRFGDITLIKVTNKSITNAYESIDEIKNVWKLS